MDFCEIRNLHMPASGSGTCSYFYKHSPCKIITSQVIETERENKENNHGRFAERIIRNSQ